MALTIRLHLETGSQKFKTSLPGMQVRIRNTTFNSQICHFRFEIESFDSVIEFSDPENKLVTVGISLLSCIEAEIQVHPVWQPSC
jgi:hypothetical protein